MNSQQRRRARQLFALLGSSNEGERENARRKLDKLLRRHGKTWNDLPEILHEGTSASAAPPPDPRDATNLSDPHPFDSCTPAQTVRGILETYVALEPHEYVPVALWIIHTHVFDQYMVTPRLLLTSPVRNCGKTTLVDSTSRLVARAEKQRQHHRTGDHAHRSS